ncbi:hypothetical protein QQ045_007452 [Rhodiola kirilowii]
MGCISSKGFGRSMSIHERFSQGVHALAIGAFPGDDFHMTAREKDRIITLIKIASSKNLRGLRYVEADTDDSTLCNKPCNDVEERYEEKRRSQISGSTELPESSAVSESDPNGQGSGRCRSFHTLEEFDELLEKIKLFEARIEEANADDGFESKLEEAQPTTRDSLDTFPLSEDDEMSSSEARLSQDNIPGTGWRRKAIGRGLQSLKLPISARAELSTVGSLKEWIHAGDDIYSPGSYETPKFGNYEMEDKNFAMFSPELVAVFEECMQQMESEELAIVKRMESEELAD